MAYEIGLKGGGFEVVEDADTYAQEGVLTTFFRSRDGRAVIDSWAKRLASYRTADISRIRWLDNAEEREEQLHRPTVQELKAS
jgi:hypothetical protein